MVMGRSLEEARGQAEKLSQKLIKALDLKTSA
jgi:hypothetical protein